MKNHPTDRLLSLDIFRGITVAGMILVNNPGSWSAIYSQLQHAQWNGCTIADIIFPFFIFIVGISITLSFSKNTKLSSISFQLYLKIIRRSLLIFGLGLFLATFPFYNFVKHEWLDISNIRIMGVLQRIAICYLFSSFIFLRTNWKQQTIIAVVLLLLYWALMSLINIPGCEYTTFNDKECNFAAYVDRLILGKSHLWRLSKVYDPEGILSTLPAIATCLSGVLCGHILQSKKAKIRKFFQICNIGIILIPLGIICSFYFPINKALWSSSFVLLTSGLAFLIFGISYWIIDVKGYKTLVKPFKVFGINALVLFVGAGLLGKLMLLIKITIDNKAISLQSAIFNSIFAPLASPVNASLMYALTYISFWFFLMWLLYRKNIYIKI